MHYTLTTKCNNNCTCCVAEEGLRQKEDSPSSHESSEGPIVISGGEPTIAWSFFDKITKANQYKVLLLTNARAFSQPSFKEKFFSLNINTQDLLVATTLYSSNAELHDSITRTPGSFGQTTLGLQNLIASGYRVELRILINKQNYRDLENIATFISKNFPDVERVAFMQMKIAGEAKKNLSSLYIEYEKTLPYLEKAINQMKKTRIQPLLLHTPLCVLPANLHKYSAGKTTPTNEQYTGNECHECEKFKECSGVWKKYIKVRGRNFLKPLKSTQK